MAVAPCGCEFAVSLLALDDDGFGAVEDDWLLGAALLLELELDGADWLAVAPPEADFFSVSVVVDDELDAPDDGALGGVAEDEELDEPEAGGVTVAEPDTELPLDGELGVVDEDEDAVSRGADGVAVELEDEVRWSGPRSQAARPRAMATASAIVEILMRPPWVGYKGVGSSLRAGSDIPSTRGYALRLGL